MTWKLKHLWSQSRRDKKERKNEKRAKYTTIKLRNSFHINIRYFTIHRMNHLKNFEIILSCDRILRFSANFSPNQVAPGIV